LTGSLLTITYINVPILIPIQDSIQEFKVHTGNLPAEWGRFAGGVINLSTKGGTQSLRGELYEYLRNRVFNANDFFLKQAGKPRPPWVQNQFGAEVGGPLNLHSGGQANRTFWFANWEGFRLRTGTPFTATVPTEAERGGDFTALGMAIMDPCAGSVLNAQGACPASTSTPSAFQGNLIRRSASIPPPMRCFIFGRLLTLLGRSRLQEPSTTSIPSPTQVEIRTRWLAASIGISLGSRSSLAASATGMCSICHRPAAQWAVRGSMPGELLNKRFGSGI